MPHTQTQEEWEAQKAFEALALTRSELYLSLRYLDAALCALPPAVDPNVQTLATEGAALHLNPTWVLDIFQRNPRFLDRCYLHLTLHCIFRHLWLQNGRDTRLWRLACDIAVESVIDGLTAPCLKRPRTWVRSECYRRLGAACGGTLAAGPVYRVLAENALTEADYKALLREFYTDDHRYWPDEQQAQSPAAQQLGQNWEKLGRRADTELDARKDEAGEGTDALQTQVQAGRSRRSYRAFLRKFAVWHEELHLDDDNFDINFYTYGLRMYGNMPLVEPQETRESLRVQELVLVVDTSYSTSGELVKRFLEETFTLLQAGEAFFRKCHIRILQCDDAVRADAKITDLDSLHTFMDSFTLLGGGGTDFRPAFRYVQELQERGEIRHLKGLLYFTDGKGIYPRKRPAYDTAFLFLGAHDDTDVPPWAMRLVLDTEEFAPPPMPEWADEPEYREDIQL